MSGRKDLTRWNRAGQTRFTYVDGNAAEYLETLRQELAARFTNADWLEPHEVEPENEKRQANTTLLEEQKRRHSRTQRISQMYQQERRDWGWEISRTFARASHILTGYADAWANEGYLGTATQWDSVRRLVGLLDYYPAPPASATTPLVIMAKKGMSGLVRKGFQVKNSPAVGADKVLFETLDDLFVDEALNGMRPAGWDKSEKPAIEGLGGSTTRGFSPLAHLPVINIQDIGTVYQTALERLGIASIRDFYDVDPESLTDSGIGITRLWEFKAKAMTICDFQPGAEWALLAPWRLADIVLEDAASLATLTENTIDDCEALQVSIALLGACLDQPAYEQATLAQLQAPRVTIETDFMLSPWRAGKKPRVTPGQVALVYHQADDRAEAVSIAEVDADSKAIRLLPSPLEYSWREWPLGEAVLRVVSRWTRKSWLNGDDVVRTAEAHGLTAGAYICWKDENDSSKYHYASVSETDKKSLRLKPGGNAPMPYAGARIMLALPITTRTMSADYLALNADAAGVTVGGVELLLPAEAERPFQVHQLFSMESSNDSDSDGGGGGLLPPASLPGLGSFLFPSPFLPIDLVKAAIEMMLNLGIMVIPSTGEPVFKGLPFDGLLEAPDIVSAAGKIVDMLDKLVLPAVWKDGLLVDTSGNSVYLEATCESAADIITSRQYVNVAGALADHYSLKCSNGKITDADDNPVGFQPNYSDVEIADKPADGDSYQLKMVSWGGGITAKADKIKAMETLLGKPKTPSILFQGIRPDGTGDGTLPEPLLSVLKGESEIRGTVVPNAPVYLFDGVADKLDSGDWIVGAFAGGLKALRIKTIEDYSGDGVEKAFSLSFDELPGDAGILEKIHADFRGELVAEGADINTTAITGDIELAPVPDALTIGQKVLLVGDGKVLASRVTAIDGNMITTDPPAVGFSKGGLVVYGNVVDVSHGVSKPTVILGSGNAAKSNQTFTLEVADVTFIPDTNMSAGVAAAIDVEVAGRIWEQVSTLKDSTAGDHHYAIRMTEEGYVKILFGDGQNGRRLPTGKNNVKVRYRVGSGLKGNLSAYSLDKVVKQNPVVDSVLQPAPAAGGGDMENTRSMRDNAPPTLLTLERAVSLADFAHLATGRSNIWQAKARSEIAGASSLEQVVVTVVPAGGAWSETIQKDLTHFLQAHTLPGVAVVVEPFEPVTEFEISVTIRVNRAAYSPDDIIKTVRTTLAAHFSLERARLGVSLYLSEVYKLVEGVEGVENSICRLIRDGQVTQLIRSDKASEVIFLTGDNLSIEWEDYLP